MKTILALVSALALLITPAALAADKYDPWFIEKRDLKKSYKRIALAPIEAPPNLEMPDAIKRSIEAQVQAHLEKRGYTVLPASELMGIREQMTEQVGGLRDPDSGEIDMQRVHAVRDHSLRELWFKNDFDALAVIRIDVIQAPIENDKAEWDGTSQKVKKKGGGLKYTASIAASSIAVSIYDVTQQPLFVNYGGLEVLMMRVKEQFEPLDASEYFQDEKRIKKAVQIAVKPI